MAISSLYEKTHFREWYYSKGQLLPFADNSFAFVYSEHFFEHLFFDEALSLLKECHRILIPSGGVIRIVVPDADLRTYEKPEPVGFPSRKLPYAHPNKHKTRWSVYLLSEALRAVGFDPVPIRFCDREGRFNDVPVTRAEYGVDKAVVCTLEYVRRPMSLIVDGVKRGRPTSGC
jgi:predicted SAM-dependent methyltransferase